MCVDRLVMKKKKAMIFFALVFAPNMEEKVM